jgi:hypothetical protein
VRLQKRNESRFPTFNPMIRYDGSQNREPARPALG